MAGGHPARFGGYLPTVGGRIAVPCMKPVGGFRTRVEQVLPLRQGSSTFCHCPLFSSTFWLCSLNFDCRGRLAVPCIKPVGGFRTRVIAEVSGNSGAAAYPVPHRACRRLAPTVYHSSLWCGGCQETESRWNANLFRRAGGQPCSSRAPEK